MRTLKIEMTILNYRNTGKRLFDLSVILLFSFIVFPLLGIVSLVQKLTLGSDVLYTQLRPGKDGIPFFLFKYRSMDNKTDSMNRLLSDADRLTKVGKFLRSTSLDELPSLFNVVKGDMSLVGPRPLLMQYMDRYTPEQRRRHEVRPGITGWAQVNGRNAISWEEKFKLDVWYVDNISFWLDMKILWMTIWKVLKQSDIGHEGHVTMEEFMGSIPEKQA